MAHSALGGVGRSTVGSFKRDGVSMNQMVTIAVAEKTAALLTLDYLEQRAVRADRAKLEAALAATPGVEPEEHDRLPDAG